MMFNLEREDSMRGILGLFLIVCIFFYPLEVLSQETGSRDQILKLGQDAVAHYQSGELETALFLLNQVLVSQPSDKEALELRKIVGNELMMQMLMQGGEFSRVARSLLLYAEKAPIRRETDFARIQKLVEVAATGNLYQKNDAIALLSSQVGELAIPAMLPYLSSSTKDTERINIILAIQRMGRTVVNPLIEALKTPNFFLKQQVAILLGHIGDRKAMPDLKKLLEDPRENPEVKKYAKTSLSQIVKQSTIILPPAKNLYYEKALAYYRDDPAYKPAMNFNWLYWEWQDNQLLYKEVPSFLYNEILAEQACYNALELDAAFKNAWALLVRIYYAQYNEILAVEEATKEKGLQLAEEELQSFSKEKPLAGRAKKIAAAAGPEILFLALRESLTTKENRPEVTVSILEAIGEVYKNKGDVPPVLLNALLHKDKRVRYSAAETIVKINPVKAFSECRRVIETLQEAMGEWDSRVVLVIEDDDESRNKLVEWITQMNVVVFAVPNGIEGLRRAQSFPPEDLVVVSTELQDISTTYLVNALREDFQSRDIPVLVVTPESKKNPMIELYQKVPQVKGVFSRPFAEVEVKSLIQKTLEKSPSNYKARATQVATRAAQVAASIQPGSVLYPYLKESGEALGKVLANNNDEIRLAAIQALGNLAETKAIPALLELLMNQKGSLAVRMQAAEALGQILSKTQTTLEKENAMRIMELLDAKEENSQFQEKIYSLLGRANLVSDVRRQIFTTQQLQKRIVVEEKKQDQESVKTVKEEPKQPKEVKEEKVEKDIWDENVPDKQETETQKETETKVEEKKAEEKPKDLEENPEEDKWGDE